jgi:hypothetical protein
MTLRSKTLNMWRWIQVSFISWPRRFILNFLRAVLVALAVSTALSFSTGSGRFLDPAVHAAKLWVIDSSTKIEQLLRSPNLTVQFGSVPIGLIEFTEGDRNDSAPDTELPVEISEDQLLLAVERAFAHGASTLSMLHSFKSPAAFKRLAQIMDRHPQTPDARTPQKTLIMAINQSQQPPSGRVDDCIPSVPLALLELPSVTSNNSFANRGELGKLFLGHSSFEMNDSDGVIRNICLFKAFKRNVKGANQTIIVPAFALLSASLADKLLAEAKLEPRTNASQFRRWLHCMAERLGQASGIQDQINDPNFVEKSASLCSKKAGVQLTQKDLPDSPLRISFRHRDLTKDINKINLQTLKRIPVVNSLPSIPVTGITLITSTHLFAPPPINTGLNIQMTAAELHAFCIATFTESNLMMERNAFDKWRKWAWVCIFLGLGSAIWATLKIPAKNEDDSLNHQAALPLLLSTVFGATVYCAGTICILLTLLTVEVAFPSLNVRSDAYFLGLAAALISILTEAIIAIGKFLEAVSEIVVDALYSSK